jgi:hypothetical protein
MSNPSTAMLPDDVKVYPSENNGYSMHIFHGMKIGNGFMYTMLFSGMAIMCYGSFTALTTLHKEYRSV